MASSTGEDGNSQLAFDGGASGVYATDEFRLYCHKILPCSKRTPHDWASCNFAHPGEKAKRRNIRTHSYDCEMCPNIVKGVECKLGANCPHSHNVFESWLHPQKYRTMMCKDRDKCTRPVCFFAHGPDELRVPTDPTPLSQQLGVAAVAAATTAQSLVAPVPNVAAFAAAGAAPSNSMQNWQLMQSQFADLARAGSNVSTLSSGIDPSGSSTPTAAPAPAGHYALPPASAAFLSPTAAGLQRSGSASSGAPVPGYIGMAHSPGSSNPGLMSLAANEQLARMIQQANNQAQTSVPGGSPQGNVSMQQLVNSLAQQVTVSKQEAQQCRDVAAQAQQQLATITAVFGPQGATAVPGSNTGFMIGDLPAASQQLQMGSACTLSNMNSSDLSSNLTYIDCSSATLPEAGSNAIVQQQLVSTAAPSDTVWRYDSGGGLVFMPGPSRTGSSTAAPAGNSRLVHAMHADAAGSGYMGSEGSYHNHGNSASLAAAGASAAMSIQQQQQLQLRQAITGSVMPSALDQQALLMGAQPGQFGAANIIQQQQLQQLQAYQTGMQQANGGAGLQNASQVLGSGLPGSHSLMYLM